MGRAAVQPVKVSTKVSSTTSFCVVETLPDGSDTSASGGSPRYDVSRPRSRLAKPSIDPSDREHNECWCNEGHPDPEDNHVNTHVVPQTPEEQHDCPDDPCNVVETLHSNLNVLSVFHAYECTCQKHPLNGPSCESVWLLGQFSGSTEALLLTTHVALCPAVASAVLAAARSSADAIGATQAGGRRRALESGKR